jgi:hypothetical protein
MIDREKVIYNLGIISVCCKNRQNIKAYDEIDREMYADWEEIIENTLTLLKEDCHNCKLECLLQKYDELKEKYDALLKEQETGHWILLENCSNFGVYCSECHTKVFDNYQFKKKFSYFCPHCGTRMEGEIERR